MLFNSLPFLVFLIVVLGLYYSFSHKYQNILLFLAGLAFYSFWDWRMSLLLLLVIYLNYQWGKNLPIHGNRFFFWGVGINIGILGFFKYAIFFLESGNDIFQLLGSNFSFPIPTIILPVGISFYTFHNISYLFDIRRKLIQPSESFINFAVYDLFFPLLLAGPIERPHSLIPQIQNKRTICPREWEHGLWLFFWGLFKKVVVADNISPFVDSAFSPGTELEPGMTPWIALVFAFQVYADFSGYTDSARGMAKMMGFRFMLNFNLPFAATSVVQFWSRWHISLSTWLRDYIYIPLGGNRMGVLRQNWNILVVWTLGGLWHGATYGYLVWGIFCGAGIVAYNVLNACFGLKDRRSALLSILGWQLTFWVFAYGLLLFRVEGWDELSRLVVYSYGMYWNETWFWKISMFIGPVVVVDTCQWLRNESESFLWVHDPRWDQSKAWIYSVLIAVGLTAFVCIGIFEQKEFFYFQF